MKPVPSPSFSLFFFSSFPSSLNGRGRGGIFLPLFSLFLLLLFVLRGLDEEKGRKTEDGGRVKREKRGREEGRKRGEIKGSRERRKEKRKGRRETRKIGEKREGLGRRNRQGRRKGREVATEDRKGEER